MMIVLRKVMFFSASDSARFAQSTSHVRTHLSPPRDPRRRVLFLSHFADEENGSLGGGG